MALLEMRSLQRTRTKGNSFMTVPVEKQVNF